MVTLVLLLFALLMLQELFLTLELIQPTSLLPLSGLLQSYLVNLKYLASAGPKDYVSKEKLPVSYEYFEYISYVQNRSAF